MMMIEDDKKENIGGRVPWFIKDFPLLVLVCFFYWILSKKVIYHFEKSNILEFVSSIF